MGGKVSRNGSCIMEHDDSIHNHVPQGEDREASYEELVQNEHTQKGKALERIVQAKRERSNSNLQMFEGRTPRVERSIKELSDDFEEGDEDGDGDGDNADTDLRKALFEAIPEPYPHTLNYQRVIISEAGDPVDLDTKDACKKLKQCMAIREKWIGAHPFPPQDIIKNCPLEVASPERAGSKKAKGEVTNFRRRLPPAYEVFGEPLPPTMGNLRFKMVEGVVRVQSVASGNGNGNGNGNGAINGAHVDGSIGLCISSESCENPDEDDLPPKFTLRHEEGLDHMMRGLSVKWEGESSYESIDWNHSLYPVPSFKEYAQDYSFVSVDWYSACSSQPHRLTCRITNADAPLYLHGRRDVLLLQAPGRALREV
jgi:hypothetical protein